MPAAPARSRAVRPVDAASLIVVDLGGPEPRFLMGRRHAAHAFMPGVLVFPGGRVEPGDRHMRVYGSLAGHTERNLMAGTSRPNPGLARALALCAVRETFEETGLLVGEGGLGVPPAAPPAWSMFAAHEVYPAPESLHFVARAVTPPRFPRRFDTRFFLAEASNVAKTVDGMCGDDSELVEIAWLSAGEAAGRNIADITRTILAEALARLERGIERDLPVPYFRERHGVWRRDEI